MARRGKKTGDGPDGRTDGHEDAKGVESAKVAEGAKVAECVEGRGAGSNPNAVRGEVRLDAARILDAKKVFEGVEFVSEAVKDLLVGMAVRSYPYQISSAVIKTPAGREVVKFNDCVRGSGFTGDEFLRMFPNAKDILNRQRGAAFVRNGLEVLKVDRSSYSDGDEGEADYMKVRENVIGNTARLNV